MSGMSVAMSIRSSLPLLDPACTLLGPRAAPEVLPSDAFLGNGHLQPQPEAADQGLRRVRRFLATCLPLALTVRGYCVVDLGLR